MMAQVSARSIQAQGYERPNFRAALIVDMYSAGVSPQATVKGFYFTALLKEAASYGQHLNGYGPYREFKDYPQQEAIRRQQEAAARAAAKKGK